MVLSLPSSPTTGGQTREPEVLGTERSGTVQLLHCHYVRLKGKGIEKKIRRKRKRGGRGRERERETQQPDENQKGVLYLSWDGKKRSQRIVVVSEKKKN